MKNHKAFIEKIIYAVSANLLSMMVSFLTTLIVPKFLGNDTTGYGYLQIYIFYIGYVGLFNFGWCDGIFLRDGGKEYSSLDRNLYSTQFWLSSVFELIISIVIILIGYISSENMEIRFIYWMVAANIFVYLPRLMLQYFLQTTNRIKEYALITTIGRTIYGIIIILSIVFLSKNYKWFVIGDLMGKTIALFVAVWLCRDIVFSMPNKIKMGINEAKINISVGMNLMLANIASMLITGIVRWGIQQQWDVATYGKVSLTMSVSNLILTFISAVALVLYPTLKRTDEKKLPFIYGTIRNILMIPMMGMLVFYYPIELVLSIWLPQYAESLRFMAILIPMCIYATKMTMLIQTYMNVFRLEKQIMKVNLSGVLVAIVTTVISVFWMKNLTLAMLSIVINQMFRCVYAEIVLSKKIEIYVLKDIITEIIMTILFIVISWFIGGWIGVGLYLLVFIGYLFIKKNDLIVSLKFLRNIK